MPVVPTFAWWLGERGLPDFEAASYDDRVSVA
jgi:hypothetical protein